MRMLPVLLVLMLVVAVACGPPGPTPARRVTAPARNVSGYDRWTGASTNAPDSGMCSRPRIVNRG